MSMAQLRRTASLKSETHNEKSSIDEKEKQGITSHALEALSSESAQEEDVSVIQKAEDVALQIITTDDDENAPVFTFRSIFLGIGLSAFGAVLATIYTFKPQNATVSQLFSLIIAYVLGTSMHSVMPATGFWRYLNPGPFNIKEHTAIVIMSSTASTMAIATEIIAALDLFYDIKLNAAAAIFQTFATQMIGYGIAGILRRLLVYPTYAFYPSYISVVSLLQSLHFGGLLSHKKRRYFWIVFAAIFFWEWIPQYPFPLLTAISIICMADNGRHTFVRNLFGAGSSNEGIGLLSFSTSWTLITQGSPLVWPLQTQINSYIGMALGYIVLTSVYYGGIFNGRDLPFMSTSLFGSDGERYNQSLIITADARLNATALEEAGLPRYSSTFVVSQLCYNLSMGSSIVYIFLWHWKELKAAFGNFNFLRSGAEIDDPHYQAMKKYDEVPSWWYLALFVASLAIGIGCSYSTKTVLMPGWSIVVFTMLAAFLSIFLGFINATTGMSITIRYGVQILAAFIHPGQPITVMYANLYGSSSCLQTLSMLQDLKLGQYVKLPPRATFAAQMAGSVVGSVFNYAMMRSIVDANREVLLDPVGTRVWSGWIIQSLNSASVAMGALATELFTYGNPYWLVPFAIFIGMFIPIPFFLVHWYLTKKGMGESPVAKFAAYIQPPVLLLYIGWLPYSVNGQWWSCVIIGFASQWWARKHRPSWFKKYNYLTSAALDGGSQVILFILSFAVFGAAGKSVSFPTWWGNAADVSVDRCQST
ncbi:OPT superfamily oligopeptide transporter [Auriculariales sp. MPI-PUGE-AT-0066]|nr:OPT superfamily oligopeptide transporter [Auriculariales sp. MPI-PUGE-AT-0066]